MSLDSTKLTNIKILIGDFLEIDEPNEIKDAYMEVRNYFYNDDNAKFDITVKLNSDDYLCFALKESSDSLPIELMNADIYRIGEIFNFIELNDNEQ
jgi:hypothetical protein